MKTQSILFSALLLLAAGSLSAQRGSGTDDDRPTPTERAERQTELLTKVLELTPEQSAQVAQINQTFAKQAEAARAQGETAREAMRESITRADTERREAMQAVLNEEQQAKLEALEAQRKERRGARDGKGRRPNRRG
ncbi:hypothetical protein LEM8419_02295 [Neolewinella maritima]|uniref:Periplasmic heavy metal sensor n=1 Tax=Neolewinella maritima TaxID=1383882 RepID=A0ABN8F706_9BACT|nr:hypothetical protein [Neolewinella maritima]CAH1001392.1 hypothetical protein LEM8419_02295 [Neolewinella maritima]